MGIFYRTIRMVDNGIKPVYVFDGKPPDMKGGELTKRAEKREEASKQLVLATDAGIYKNFMVVLCRILWLNENWFLIYL
jgi:flap endonuclease-1